MEFNCRNVYFVVRYTADDERLIAAGPRGFVNIIDVREQSRNTV